VELLGSDSGLLDFEPPDFTSRQLTVANACSNSQLLLTLTFINVVSTMANFRYFTELGLLSDGRSDREREIELVDVAKRLR
jgi:hypothetical protein